MFTAYTVLALAALALSAIAAEQHHSIELTARTPSSVTRARALSKRASRKAAAKVPLLDYFSYTDLQYAQTPHSCS
jgi:hypothetical protein